MVAKQRGIPISIHPFFWVFSVLIGYLMSSSIYGTAIWVVIIFVSVLVHELGHATMALIFKQKPKIELIAMGGLTSYHGKKLKYYQQFLIVLNGPLFGVGLFVLATFVLWLHVFQNPTIVASIKIFQVVNIFWSIVNLLPVLPLDGGQLMRIALEGFFGVKGFKLSFLIGFVIAGIIALGSFVIRNYLMGALFFLFAFQSFDMYRRTRNITKADIDQKFTDELQKAQRFIEQGNKEEAEKLLLDLRNRTHEGLIYNQATHVLALLAFEKKETNKAYEYLLSIKDKLTDEDICLMHNLAFEENNYKLVTELSSSCYKLSPTKKVALINARAFAILGEARPAGGWLKTASQFDNLDIKNILNEKYFDKVKNDASFKNFFN